MKYRGPESVSLPLAVAALAACALWVSACRTASPPTATPGASQPAAVGGYPGGSLPPPSPGSTPLAPDAAGYYPAPADVPLALEALDTSRHSALLTALQAELDLRDAGALADRVWDDRGGVGLGRPETTQGGSRADQAEARRYVEALLHAGSPPKLQGYLDVGGGCLEVVSAPWPGHIVFPTPKVPNNNGESAPLEFATDAASWRLCGSDAEDDWQWTNWSWLEPEAGPRTYAELVRRLLPEAAGPYVVLRPTGSDLGGR